MPSLLDLPLELLTLIVQETIPADFEATALTCQTLFAASTPFRKQYNTRRRRFRNFIFSSRLGEQPNGVEESESCEYWDEITKQTGIRIMNTRQLLEQIAQDPSLAHYIQSLNLRGPDDDDEDEELISSLEVTLPENLQHLVHSSPFIEAVGGDPADWIGGIQRSMVDADVFLLTLLPQVQVLTLHPRWDNLNPFDLPNKSNNDRLWSVLKLITHRANHATEFPDAPLSKLSAVEPSREMGYEERSSLTPFVPFMAINSVSEVSLSSCIFKDDGYTGLRFDPMVERYSTNLRKLSLEFSIAGAEELSQLLARIPNLEVFEFSQNMKWHGCGYSWNWGAFLDVVQNICAKTLKKLSVTMLEHYGDPGATLQDMTHFERLAVLELDVAMLCGPPYDPSMRDLEYDEFGSPGDAACPRLADLLPTSIRKFTLYLGEFSEKYLKCIAKVIEGLEEARGQRLSKLRALRIFVQSDIPNEALEVLHAAKDSGFSILEIGTKTSVL